MLTPVPSTIATTVTAATLAPVTAAEASAKACAETATEAAAKTTTFTTTVTITFTPPKPLPPPPPAHVCATNLAISMPLAGKPCADRHEKGMCDAHAEKTGENVSAMKRAASVPRSAELFATPGVLRRAFRAVAGDLARDIPGIVA
jgi:hypothetical protein